MAVVTIGGTQPVVQTLTLSSGSDTQVGFFNNVNTVTIKARTAVDLQVRSSPNSSDYFTIPSGQSLSLDLMARVINGVTQPFNIWLRAATGSAVAEIIGLYGG